LAYQELINYDELDGRENTFLTLELVAWKVRLEFQIKELLKVLFEEKSLNSHERYKMRFGVIIADLNGSKGSNADLKPKGLGFESQIRQSFICW
jgi:hypothetical protein